MDNAVPHLQSDGDIEKALLSMRARLRRGGTLLLSWREFTSVRRKQTVLFNAKVSLLQSELRFFILS
jgi:hypothetical protein